MAHRFVRVLACLWLLMVWIAPAGAQQFTGGVRGAVRDANGVVPGVAVTITNEATNIALPESQLTPIVGSPAELPNSGGAW